MRGFTYAGGLVRHEREVHGKHGGAKEIFHCPYNTCKRHSGEGFKRQDNLREHLKRMHHVEEEVDSGHEEGADVKTQHQDDESEDGEIRERHVGPLRTLHTLPRASFDPTISRKRKWSTASLASDYTVGSPCESAMKPMTAKSLTTATGSSDDSELLLEVNRLRLVIVDKDAEIAHLKQVVYSLQGAIHSLTTPAGDPNPG